VKKARTVQQKEGGKRKWRDGGKTKRRRQGKENCQTKQIKRVIPRIAIQRQGNDKDVCDSHWTEKDNERRNHNNCYQK